MAAKRKPAKPKTPRKPKVVQPTAIIDPNEISPQMLLFVDHYIVTMNGTEAARLAKYSGDDATLAATASRLLRNDKVLREISRRLETYSMSANEVLVRLTDMARGDIADAFNSSGSIDVLEAKRRARSHLIKRYKHKRKTITTTDGNGDNGSEILEDEYEIEMYDAQAALNTLMKFHGLLVDRVKVETWEDRAIADIRAGKLDFVTLRDAFDESLARRLFLAAGVPVE